MWICIALIMLLMAIVANLMTNELTSHIYLILSKHYYSEGKNLSLTTMFFLSSRNQTWTPHNWHGITFSFFLLLHSLSSRPCIPQQSLLCGNWLRQTPLDLAHRYSSYSYFLKGIVRVFWHESVWHPHQQCRASTVTYPRLRPVSGVPAWFWCWRR